MRLVNDHQSVARQVIEQRGGRLARFLACEVSRIVFNASTKTHLLDHFKVKHRSLMQPLRFNEFSFVDELWFPPLEFLFNGLYCAFDRWTRHHVVGLRVDWNSRCMLFDDFTQQWIDRRNRINLIPPQFNPVRQILIARIDFDNVAANSKAAALKINVRTFVLNFNQLLEQHFSRHPLARFDKEQKTVVRIRIAKTVNARNARHDDYIASFEQSTSCGHSKTIY